MAEKAIAVYDCTRTFREAAKPKYGAGDVVSVSGTAQDNLTAGVNRFFLSDHGMACRLEGAEANANARFVEARARLEPASGAQWTQIGGAYAMFDGVRSPCTQTFGLGLFEMPSADDMTRLEEFFKSRGAPIFHEVSPLADKNLIPMLNERGYRPIELTSVMFLPLEKRRPAAANTSDEMKVRVVGESEHGLWARTAAEGWQLDTEFADLMLELMRINVARADGACFLVEMREEPIAAGALAIHKGVALLAGASTLPQWRRQGAQKALHEARLRYAAQVGCDLAMVCATPGSASQRNAERQDFRIAYTRIKFELAR